MSQRVAQEEIFGPVLAVMTFRAPEEAIERANNTPYGLSAGVWTDKGSKIFKMAAQLRAGSSGPTATTNLIPPAHSAVTRKAVLAGKGACRDWRAIAGLSNSSRGLT